VGRFAFITHSVGLEDDIRYNTAWDVFPRLKGKEFYRTTGFKEIAMIYGDTEDSFRKTAKLINRMRHQEQGGTPYRTLQEATEREGTKLLDFVKERSKRILIQHSFTEEGQYKRPGQIDEGSLPVMISAEQVEEQLGKMSLPEDVDVSELLANPVPHEAPQHSAMISIDDVTPKRQEETRVKGGRQDEPKRKYVHNTIIHIESGGKKYTLSALGLKTALSFLIAFLLSNALKWRRFQFFMDGHKTLIDTILKMFAWKFNMGLILDWYHLAKKCKEQLSLALKGRHIRNQVLRDIMPLLWNGLTQRAIDVLKAVDPNQIKSIEHMEKLTAYLERNQSYIPCYALRKRLGLRNSSSIGEKMNDLIVSQRQKHNGMSWSPEGSSALAAITALKRNKENLRWFEQRTIAFKLAA
jgi:hypothetical protein